MGNNLRFVKAFAALGEAAKAIGINIAKELSRIWNIRIGGIDHE